MDWQGSIIKGMIALTIAGMVAHSCAPQLVPESKKFAKETDWCRRQYNAVSARGTPLPKVDVGTLFYQSPSASAPEPTCTDKSGTITWNPHNKDWLALGGR